MDEMTPTQRIATCAERLRGRWATVEQVQSEKVAVVIWNDAALRTLAPAEAAARWLSPITTPLQ